MRPEDDGVSGLGREVVYRPPRERKKEQSASSVCRGSIAWEAGAAARAAAAGASRSASASRFICSSRYGFFPMFFDNSSFEPEIQIVSKP